MTSVLVYQIPIVKEMRDINSLKAELEDICCRSVSLKV